MAELVAPNFFVKASGKMQFGYQCPLYPWELVSDVALFSEKAGFDSVFMADHITGIGIRNVDSLEAWTTLGSLAAKTERVRLGTCVTEIHRHHPAVLAQKLSTLDAISGGRTILGIGAGEAMNLVPYGIEWDKPVSKMREAIIVMKRLWTEERVDFEGSFYKLRKAFVSKPVQKPHPPVWVAGNSDGTLRIAGELAEGWVPMGMPASTYRKKLGKVGEWAERAGRDPSSIEMAMFTYAVVAKDPGEARNLIELPAKMFALLNPKMLHELGYRVTYEFDLKDFVFSDPKRVEMLLEEARKLPFESVEASYVYGSPDECIHRIEEFKEAGVQHLILAMFVSRRLMKGTLELFAERVLPYFKEPHVPRY